jgi:hypothetical protein
MEAWTTRLAPELTRQYGCEEIHNACFEPPTWSKQRAVVSLGVPECEMHFCIMVNGVPVVQVNRPTTNRNVKSWLRTACQIAAEAQAWISLSCDTAEQAEINARRIAKHLPKYRRVALERMYEATSRERNKLA